MKKNREATDFIENLCAAFNRFLTAPHIKTFYAQKISSWNLKPEQWNSVLDLLISWDSVKDPGRLPAINVIFEAITKTLNNFNTKDYGWYYFRLNGYDYALRVKYVEEKWVSLKTGAVPKIPYNAENIMFRADMTEEQRKEEFRNYSNEINEKIKTISDNSDIPF